MGRIGIDTHTLLCLQQVANENLQHRTGDCALRGHLNGKEIPLKKGVLRFMGSHRVRHD